MSHIRLTFQQTRKYNRIITHTLILLLILRQELVLRHSLLRNSLRGDVVLIEEVHQHNHHSDNGDATHQSSLQYLQANIPDGFLIDNINSLVHEGGGVVVAISLVEDSQSKQVLLGVQEVVDTEDVEEVHLITRVQSAVEVALSKLMRRRIGGVRSGGKWRSR